jgi:hypothetical protein
MMTSCRLGLRTAARSSLILEVPVARARGLEVEAEALGLRLAVAAPVASIVP